MVEREKEKVMNKTVLADRLWSVYRYLPHCLLITHYKNKQAQKSFNYANRSDISIIAVNCVGGEIYSILNLPFKSPFINTAMNRKDFITMCMNLKEYLESPLSVRRNDKGGWEGYLGRDSMKQLRIRFDHDCDPDDICRKWSRRVQRINWDKIVIICDDKDLDEADYTLFDTIDAYKKVMLTAKDRSSQYTWCHQLQVYKNKSKTGTYNGKSLWGGWVFQYVWDYVQFLNAD